MAAKREILQLLFERHIKDTEPKAIVTDKTVTLCLLTNQVNKVILRCCGLSRVSINTKALKHLYDKKPAEEFHFIINSLHKIVKYPDHIYRNKDHQRGDWGFVKKIKNELYICSLSKNDNFLEIATAFRIRKEKYLKNYTLLWSWEDDKSPS